MSDPGEAVPLKAREDDDWERVSNGLHSWTQRRAVDGGWIYRTVVREHVAMCFVPDVGTPGTGDLLPVINAIDRLTAAVEALAP